MLRAAAHIDVRWVLHDQADELRYFPTRTPLPGRQHFAERAGAPPLHSLTLGGQDGRCSVYLFYVKPYLQKLSTGYPPFACGGWHMGDEDAEPEGAAETFGALRLQLKSGTASGYVGRRASRSQRSGRCRDVGASQGREAALLGIIPNTAGSRSGQRARALACGVESLPSPSMQLRYCCALSATLMFPFPLSTHLILSLSESPSRVVTCVHSQALGRQCAYTRQHTLINENVPKQQLVAGGKAYPPPRDAEEPPWPQRTRRRARSSHQAARAHARDARGGRQVGPASLKRGLSHRKILPRQRVATRFRFVLP